MTCQSLARLWCVVLFAITPLPVIGQEVIVGLKASDFSGNRATGLAVEYHGKPFRRFGQINIGFGGSAVADNDSSLWIGAGVWGKVALGGNWFGEVSFFPGYYDAGSLATDLGSDLPPGSSLAVM